MKTEMTPRSTGLVRALLYPVVQEKDPCAHVDRVLCVTVDRRVLDGTADEYRQAVQGALESGQRLGSLLPGLTEEGALREFLQQIQSRLA